MTGVDEPVARSFIPDDQDAVRALILDGLRERWGDAYDDRANPDLDHIEATYVARGADIVVIELHGVVVACGTLQPDANGRGQIVRLSADRHHRRDGLGRQVIDELLLRARRRLVEVHVLVDILWTSAVALYRSCGFVEADHDDTHIHLFHRWPAPE
jgi:ribosomal protein S18 acetylase RimI-like enzyme